MHIRKRLILTSIGILLGVIACEILLQVISFAVWMTATPATIAPVRAGVPTVLCIGDSYTFGLGADQSDRDSYPAELQRLIDKRGQPDLRVVKAAWPSRNSREVLLNLTDQLARHNPKRVYVLVGMNDMWRSTPRVEAKELTQPTADNGFPIHWRTGRFVALIGAWLTDRSPKRPTDGPAFLGTWTSDTQAVTFFANGRLLFSPSMLHWQEEADHLVITSGEVELTRYLWQCDGERLTLTPIDGDVPIVLGRGTTSAEIIEQNTRTAIGVEPPGIDPETPIDPAGDRPIDAHTKQLGPELVAKRKVLSAHLGDIIELCRKHGAVPVLLSYPWDVHGVRGVPEDVARRTGAEFIDFLPHFEHLLQSMSVEQLYIPDGHCTTRGYAEMASVLLDDVIRTR